MLHRPTSHSPAIGPGCAGPPLAVPTPAVLDHVPAQPLHPVQGGPAFAVDPQLCSNADPTQRTQYVLIDGIMDAWGMKDASTRTNPFIRNPYVTGTSVLAFVYKDGILIACDTLGMLATLMLLLSCTLAPPQAATARPSVTSPCSASCRSTSRQSLLPLARLAIFSTFSACSTSLQPRTFAKMTACTPQPRRSMPTSPACCTTAETSAVADQLQCNSEHP